VFTIAANAFCHQMVRSIVGFMIDVGKGRRRAAQIEAVLAARDRSKASNMAPPHGLTLWEVGY
jgi:tRNA pseudouridine38-40 synthase